MTESPTTKEINGKEYRMFFFSTRKEFADIVAKQQRKNKRNARVYSGIHNRKNGYLVYSAHSEYRAKTDKKIKKR